MPNLTSNPAEIQQYLALLEDTPRRFSACTGGLDDGLLHRSPAKGEWSAADILVHLRGCEEIWTFTIYVMLSEDNPSLPLFGGRDWVKVTKMAKLNYHDLLQVFVLRRAELLHVLRPLPESGWNRTCIIGNHQHSVFSQARRMALHESEHCDQIEALMKTMLQG